jgi:hypothetical protein
MRCLTRALAQTQAQLGDLNSAADVAYRDAQQVIVRFADNNLFGLQSICLKRAKGVENAAPIHLEVEFSFDQRKCGVAPEAIQP